VRRGYHLGMPTRRTKQHFLKPQPWQSSDQIEFTQVRQKVKAPITRLAVRTCLNCVPHVSSFELPISARPHSSTSGTPLGRLPV
jgi:hypothetical protein